jgi:hypothetical protein
MPAFAPFKSKHDVSQPQLGESTTMKDDLRYNALHDEDARSESSSTEVEDWDTESHEKLRSKRTVWAKLRAWKWLLDTSLLLVILGLLLDRQWKSHPKTPAFELAGDITGFAPKFSQQIVQFKPDPVFTPENASEFWSNETQRAWLDIVPGMSFHPTSCLHPVTPTNNNSLLPTEGLGYVLVKDPQKYNNLPHPIHDYPGHTVYTTSVTHQLHCLYTVVEAYNTLKIMRDSPLANVDPIKMPWHINHCFEYMRQAIMCAGDVALEGAATTFPAGEGGDDRGGSDGWDARHVCRDYGQVKDYLEDRTMNHWKWISSD